MYRISEFSYSQLLVSALVPKNPYQLGPKSSSTFPPIRDPCVPHVLTSRSAPAYNVRFLKDAPPFARW